MKREDSNKNVITFVIEYNKKNGKCAFFVKRA